MSTRPPAARIICPQCPARDGRPVAIALAGGEETVRCPQCAAYFRIQTAVLGARAAQQVLGNRTSHYGLTLHSATDGPAYHEFTGPMGMQLGEGDEVSLVWQGRHMVGVANQSAQLWYPIEAYEPEAEPLRLNGWVGAVAAVAVAGAMLVTYRTAIADALLGGGIGGALLVIVALAITLAPWVADTLARSGGE